MKRKKAIAKVDAREASFGEWFEAQYGPRPDVRPLPEMLDEAYAAKKWAERLMSNEKHVQAWETQRDAALAAWQASREQKR